MSSSLNFLLSSSVVHTALIIVYVELNLVAVCFDM